MKHLFLNFRYTLRTWPHVWTTLNAIIQKYCTDHISLSQKIHTFSSSNLPHVFWFLGAVILIRLSRRKIENEERSRVTIFCYNFVCSRMNRHSLNLYRIYNKIPFNQPNMPEMKKSFDQFYRILLHFPSLKKMCKHRYKRMKAAIRLNWFFHIFLLGSYWTQRIEVNKLQIHARSLFWPRFKFNFTPEIECMLALLA